MTVSTSKNAFSDCFDLFDRALLAPRGIRNSCDGPGPANSLRGRLHKARIHSRALSRDMHPEDHPDYDTSPYDDLIVRVKEAEGKWWVYIEPRRVEGTVEELERAAE